MNIFGFDILRTCYAFEKDFDEDVEAYLKADIDEYLTIPTDKNGKPLMSREERREALATRLETRKKLSVFSGLPGSAGYALRTENG